MSEHRTHIDKNGKFQSDKYPTCPPGKVPLSVEDPTAQDLLWEYAIRRRSKDIEFCDDLKHALRDAGYDPTKLGKGIRPDWPLYPGDWDHDKHPMFWATNFSGVLRPYISQLLHRTDEETLAYVRETMPGRVGEALAAWNSVGLFMGVVS